MLMLSLSRVVLQKKTFPESKKVLTHSNQCESSLTKMLDIIYEARYCWVIRIFFLKIIANIYREVSFSCPNLLRLLLVLL